MVEFRLMCISDANNEAHRLLCTYAKPYPGEVMTIRDYSRLFVRICPQTPAVQRVHDVACWNLRADDVAGEHVRTTK